MAFSVRSLALGSLLLAGNALWPVCHARAGDCPEFAQAADISAEQFDDLTVSRAVVVEPANVNLRGGDGAVRAYLALPSSYGDAGQRGLAYYVATGEAVCLYYWSSGGDARSFRLAMDGGSLQYLVDDALRAVSQDAAPVERRARRRGGEEDPDREGVSRSATSLARGTEPADDPAPLLRKLSDVLFPEPLRGEIESLSSLTVVPALNIGIVPFSGLDPDGDGRPLVDATMVNVEAGLRDVLAGRAYGIGGGVDPQSITGDPDATGDPDWIFPRLPGAAREARAIAGRFGTVAIIGPEATVAEVSQKMAGAEYIHVAAHGYSDPDDPIDGSFLALTGGRLTAREIQGMKFEKSPLVVLSACQTGLGGTLRAGIIGLARAFLFAGSSSVVASLWNVDDEATSFIMTRFAENIAAHSPAEALRLAQNDARQRWPAPRVWAAFIVFGSRTVSFLDAPALSGEQHLPVEAEFTLRRSNQGEGERLDLSVRTDAYPGDALYFRAVNGSFGPVDVMVAYVDVDGEVTPIDEFRLHPGDVFDKGLIALADSTLGHERMVAVFEEADSLAPIKPPRRLDGLSPLSVMLALVGPEAIGALLPSRGITPILDLGPQSRDGIIQAPVVGEGAGPPVRRAYGIVSLDVRPER